MRKDLETYNKGTTLILFRMREQVNAVENLDSGVLVNINGLLLGPSVVPLGVNEVRK